MVGSVTKLNLIRKWHGQGKAMAFLGGGILERVFRVRIDRVRIFEWKSASQGRPLDERFEWRFLTPDEVRYYAAIPNTDLDESFARRMDQGDMCFGAIRDGRLISYRGYARGEVDPEHSSRVRMRFPADAVYVYKAFTIREYRGQQLMGRPYSLALDYFLRLGITKMIALIDFTNWSSLKMNQRAGYKDLGVLVTHHLRGDRVVYTPSAANKAGIYFEDPG